MKNKFITLIVAAIMVVMATTTVFASEAHWVNNDGVWTFVKADGEPATEKFVKSGNEWYWVNEDGIMVTSQLVEDGDHLYYVDEDGKMVTNTWVFINNDDFENRWLYFAPTGRAQKNGWRTVNGKKYFFEDYAMNYGFLDAEGHMIDADKDDAWKDATYYCGDENDGAQKLGWVQVDSLESDTAKDWLYFAANGKKVAGCTKTINGKTYAFNEDGSMKVAFDDATVASASVSVTKFMNDDGSVVKKGWIYAYMNEDAEDKSWFYAQNNGQLVKSAVKTINGKKYAFDSMGRMMTGFVEVDENGTVPAEDVAHAAVDVTFADAVGTGLGHYYMYFTEDADPNKQGPAVKGKTTIAIDDAKITVNFSSRGIAESTDGCLVVKNNFVYVNSIVYAREDMDYKYEVIMDVTGEFYILNVANGRAYKKGTFTDSSNEIKYVLKDGIVTIYIKDANGKWVVKTTVE